MTSRDLIADSFRSDLQTCLAPELKNSFAAEETAREGLLCKADTDECCMLSGCHGALPASLQKAGQPLGAVLPALCVHP